MIDIPDLLAGTLGVSRGTAYDLMREALASEAKEQPAQQQDDYEAWYIEAMVASNEVGFSGMSAAETIRELSRMVAEQPAQQEPVAIVAVDGLGQIQVGWITKPQHNDKLYTSPPAQRTWVGLTHEEHMEIMTGTMTTSSRMAAVEAKLKEKNT